MYLSISGRSGTRRVARLFCIDCTNIYKKCETPNSHCIDLHDETTFFAPLKCFRG